MKIKLLTVAVSALLAAGSVNAAEVYNKDSNKLDLYGKVTGLHYFSNDDGSDGDRTHARLGFKGETQISSQLSGYGQWEYEFKANGTEANGSEGNKTRLGYAGLKFGEYGSFDYGRNYGVAYDIGAWTDMLPEFGGDTWTQTDNFMTGRAAGVATYRNTGFFGLVDGLNFALQYQGKNENGRTSNQNGDGWGTALTWENNGFGVGATYAASDRTETQDGGVFNADGRKAEIWATGLKYDLDGVYLAATYAETRNMTTFGANNYAANEARNVELVAQYQFDSGLRPSVAYLRSKGQDLKNDAASYGNRQTLVEYVSVGATYYFNKNMSVYGDYKINLMDETQFTHDMNIATDDIVALGLTYQF